MAEDKKISQLHYYSSDNNKIELPDGTTTVFGVDSEGLTYKVEKWQILSNELLSFRTFLKSFSGSVVYLWSYSKTGGSKKVSPASPIYLNNSGSIALLGVGTATTSTPGVASFSGSDFNITSGLVTLKKIDHGALNGLADDDHTIYVKNTGGKYAANVIATWYDTGGRFIKASGSPAQVDSSGNIFANNIKTNRGVNSIPKTGSADSFLNSWFKETVYLKVVPETTPIPANTTGLIKFNVPRILNGRTIKYVKCRVYTPASTSTISLKIGGTAIATLTGSGGVIASSANTTIATDDIIRVDTGTTAGTGLDLYFEVE